jgi:branched-chain amino acid transport system permease protein
MNVLQVLFTSLSLSAIYALLALGFVVIYKGTRVVNLAQGAIMMVGVYAVFKLNTGFDFWIVALLGILLGALFAIVIQIILSLSKSQDHLVATIVTIAIDMIVTAILAVEMRDLMLYVAGPWSDSVIQIGDASMPLARAAAFVTAIIVIGLFFVVFKYTSFGVKMRSAASDSETAALMGVSQRRVAIWSWGIGGALAVIAGIFLAGFPGAGLGAHSGAMAMAVIPAIIIGGMDSAEGAIVGALIVGFTESVSRYLVAAYAPWMGEQIAIVVPYILMLAVLLVRPSGLFGSKEISRV